MSQMMGLTETSNEAFIAAVEKMLDDIGIPKSFEEIGVPADCAQRIAEKAIQDSAAGTNPRPATVAEIRKLIEVAIVKAR
jgi:alcohol dehydrogenase class IV